VPDFYQGHEAIELSLVDPDNRRAIDFGRRREMLAQARAMDALPDRAMALRELLEHAVDGRAKFWVTWQALRLRREQENMLRRAEYVPLEVRGERARHVVAFARRDGSRWLVVVGARLMASLGQPVGSAPIGAVWSDTSVVLPETDAWPAGATAPWLEDAIGGGRHALQGGTLPLASVLREFPVAALFGAFNGGHEEPRRAGAGVD